MIIFLINKFYKQTRKEIFMQVRKDYLYDYDHLRQIIADLTKVLSSMEQNKNLTKKEYRQYRLYNYILGEVKMFINKQHTKGNVAVVDGLPKWQ